MASRKTVHPFRKRTGLRSQAKKTSRIKEEDKAWEMATTSEEEEVQRGFEAQRARPKGLWTSLEPSQLEGREPAITEASSAGEERLRLELPTPPRPHITRVRQAPRPSPVRAADQTKNSNASPFLQKELKVPVYQQGADIENYLLRFERMGRSWQWSEEEWAC
ncbi:hypothetical protein SKAU_G00087980 [Synaphobranchus kaupii]|uniref:Uncharacterized protein n=1 Tax=Synaphobranchus kaupii TaxID=118154 RepID=A0A9Q1FWZ2_SYNKA|nr:hypothetical protein SKAU_G00087980 [Synaphobranchus kaupii]